MGTGASDARRVLSDALAGNAGDVRVDTSAVEAVDLTGLGVLVAAHDAALRAGRRLLLTEVPPQLARVLTLTRLGRVLVGDPSSRSRRGTSAA